MTDILDSRGMTTREALGAAADRWPDAPLFISPPEEGRPWDPEGREVTYDRMRAEADRLAAALHIAGYGPGHRIALDLENRAEHMIWKFAANSIGVSVVPVNPELRAAELAYILSDSAPRLAVVAPNRARAFAEANFEQRKTSRRHIQTLRLDEIDPGAPIPGPGVAAASRAVSPAEEASLIYTSGTTGKPKGCMLSQGYELEIGRWYAVTEGILDFQPGDRLYNPLPLFHVNAMLLSFFGMMHMGGAQVQPARFSRAAWWKDIRACKATVAHYLGVVIPVLMAGEPDADERDHGLRVMMGAGVEPSLHGPAQERFGVPLVEGWGMTEMCRALTADSEPRMIDTRAIGRPRPGLEVQVWDEENREVPRGTPGEMVLRSPGENPRAGFFSGYLNREAETEEAWSGGWFHTGDTVMMDETDMVFFVDRKKNIIRRSGENIAAAEVEACLLEHPAVATVAVLAVEDPIRDEEVMACVTVKGGAARDAALAEALFAHVFARLAYYKAPGWLRFFDDLPVTGTQKIQKHALFAEGESPTDGAFDFRDRKKRGAA
ncbi:AMP-binding protein [Rhodovulum sp. DZ06]|uniref:AMP-binding protein n=1 Tax=Rhodovulum sp. DZ06 TaxID=3425126 RepID=UPI003D329CFF